MSVGVTALTDRHLQERRPLRVGRRTIAQAGKLRSAQAVDRDVRRQRAARRGMKRDF